jgi:hypothetical protein
MGLSLRCIDIDTSRRALPAELEQSLQRALGWRGDGHARPGVRFDRVQLRARFGWSSLEATDRYGDQPFPLVYDLTHRLAYGESYRLDSHDRYGGSPLLLVEASAEGSRDLG